MKLFLSTECYGMADSRWVPLMLELEPMLNEYFGSVNYSCLNDIAIISIILPEEYMDVYPERVYFCRKKFYADVRLYVNYRSFVYCREQKRMRIYVEHILASIKALEKKMKSDEEKSAYNDIIYHATLICNEYLKKHNVEPVPQTDIQ